MISIKRGIQIAFALQLADWNDSRIRGSGSIGFSIQMFMFRMNKAFHGWVLLSLVSIDYFGYDYRSRYEAWAKSLKSGNSDGALELFETKPGRWMGSLWERRGKGEREHAGDHGDHSGRFVYRSTQLCWVSSLLGTWGLPRLPYSQRDVGGWENYPEIHRPDDWEQKHGLNPGFALDASSDPDGVGFTCLEDYLNHLSRSSQMNDEKKHFRD